MLIKVLDIICTLKFQDIRLFMQFMLSNHYFTNPRVMIVMTVDPVYTFCLPDAKLTVKHITILKYDNHAGRTRQQSVYISQSDKKNNQQII